MPYPYDAMPSSSTWTSDSSITFTLRSSDRVLTVIDDLVEAYNKEELKNSRPEILFHLRQALRFWIKKVNVVPQNTAPDGLGVQDLPSSRKFSGEAGRREAMQALLAIVEQLLCEHFDVHSSMLLEDTLIENYGSPNHEQEKDDLFLSKYEGQEGMATYLRTDGLKRKYKLRFRGGKAWRWNRLVDDYRIYDSTDNSESETNDQLVHFVMDNRGRIYAGFEQPGETAWFKHSSLVGGSNAFSAGRMKVVNGVVTEVTNDSGHYQPDHRHMRNLLQRLLLYGANISKTTVIRLSDKKPFAAEKVRLALSAWPDGKRSY